MVDAGIEVDGLAVLWEEVLEFCGIEGVIGWECATCDCAQIRSSEQVLGQMASRAEFIMAPEETAPEH